jgi:tetratricopeptide (TPR) repeat protein
MKKIIFLLAMLFSFSKANAQLKIPALSPAAAVEQQIGLAKATVTYSRPSLRGRKMLGEAYIPFGIVWRMGANTVTTLKLDDDVLIGGKALAKGNYAMVAIPEANEWTIVINSDAKQWGVYDYKLEKDVLRFKVKKETLSQSIETQTFVFEDITPTSANLVFRWENTQFKIAFSQDADAKIMADIKRKTSRAIVNPMVKMEAAEYYLMMNRDLEQALQWSMDVNKIQKSPFTLNLQAQIAQKLGKCDMAIDMAKQAIEKTQKNGDVAARKLAEMIIETCK